MQNTSTATAKAKSWRDVLPVHPAADLFPMMSPDELKVLGEDIKRNGLEVPIVLAPIDKRPFLALLDGRNRLDAMEAAGVPVGITIVNRNLTMDATFRHTLVSSKWDPYAYVISANIHRRHLTGEQKRGLIEKALKAQPEKSDRQLAKLAKVDHKTVGAVREKMEARGEIPHVGAVIDTKGRKQPSKTKRRDVDDFLAEKREGEAAGARPRCRREPRGLPPSFNASPRRRRRRSRFLLVAARCRSESPTTPSISSRH
jgi:hypothetical protein